MIFGNMLEKINFPHILLMAMSTGESPVIVNTIDMVPET